MTVKEEHNVQQFDRVEVLLLAINVISTYARAYCFFEGVKIKMYCTFPRKT